MIHQAKSVQRFVIGAIEKGVFALIDDDENIRSQDQAILIRARPGRAARIGLANECTCRAAAQGSRECGHEILGIDEADDDVRRGRAVDHGGVDFRIENKIIQNAFVHFRTVDAPGVGNTKANPVIEFVDAVIAIAQTLHVRSECEPQES